LCESWAVCCCFAFPLSRQPCRFFLIPQLPFRSIPDLFLVLKR